MSKQKYDHYSMLIQWDKDDCIYVVTVPELPGCQAYGKTRFSAHDKWMRDYNFQKHMAHEKRQDGCHSPAEVLGWVKGMQPEPALVHQAFSAICETRRLDKAGYATFRNWSLYGEHALAGEIAQVNIFQDFLTLVYEQEKLSRYSVEWQPDARHLA